MGQNKKVKVFVLFLVANHRQFLDELPKILNQGDADGVILTNMFGSEILTTGAWPNLLQLASLAKKRYPNKDIGVEIYDSINIQESMRILNWAKTNDFDMLWCKQGSIIVDKIKENHLIVSGIDEGGIIGIEKVKTIKSTMLKQNLLVVTGGLTSENVLQFIPHVDMLVVHRPAIIDTNHPYSYDVHKIKSLCEIVRHSGSVSV